MRSLFFIILIIHFYCASAQEKKNIAIPDYTSIEKTTTDKNSAGYYPKLLTRYMSNDTTITLNEMQLLYYGRYFYEGIHEPSAAASARADAIKLINAQKVITDEDKKKLISYYFADYQQDPFDLNTLEALNELYEHFNDPLAKVCFSKMKKIARVIINTGDGLTINTAFHVNAVADEYAIINIMGYEDNGNPSFVEDKCDYHELKNNSDKLKGLYFYVEPVYLDYEKAHNTFDPKKMLDDDDDDKNNK